MFKTNTETLQHIQNIKSYIKMTVLYYLAIFYTGNIDLGRLSNRNHSKHNTLETVITPF